MIERLWQQFQEFRSSAPEQASILLHCCSILNASSINIVTMTARFTMVRVLDDQQREPVDDFER